MWNGACDQGREQSPRRAGAAQRTGARRYGAGCCASSAQAVAAAQETTDAHRPLFVGRDAGAEAIGREGSSDANA